MSVQQRRKYDSDFKRNVQLSKEPGRTVAEAEQALFNNIENYYNRQRR